MDGGEISGFTSRGGEASIATLRDTSSHRMPCTSTALKSLWTFLVELAESRERAMRYVSSRCHAERSMTGTAASRGLQCTSHNSWYNSTVRGARSTLLAM